VSFGFKGLMHGTPCLNWQFKLQPVSFDFLCFGMEWTKCENWKGQNINLIFDTGLKKAMNGWLCYLCKEQLDSWSSLRLQQTSEICQWCFFNCLHTKWLLYDVVGNHPNQYFYPNRYMWEWKEPTICQNTNNSHWVQNLVLNEHVMKWDK
jgi:hypothetical protein